MLRKLLTLLTMVLSVAASAKDYKFTEGVNSIDAFQDANATFTPSRDGRVLIEAREVWTITYDDKQYEHSYVPASDFAFVYELNDVKAGKDISLYLSFPLNATKIRITLYGEGVVPVEVLNVSPRVGKTFDWNTTGMVSVNFSKGVSLSSVKFVAGDYVTDVDDVHVGTGVGFNLTNALNGALKEGKLQVGEKFQVKISGLRDMADKNNLYNGDGELVLEYIAPYPQYEFVSAKVGEESLTYLQANTYKFLSYYSPDSEDGLFEFEFEGEIGKVGGVMMTMGNLDLDAQGKYHRSNLPYTVSGNKLLVDARGTLRTLAVLFPAIIEEEGEEGEEGNEMLGTFDKEHVTITLSNVIDINGNAFLCKAQGSVGSYSFVMGYREIVDEVYIDGDNKQDGDEVCPGEDVSLWVSNGDIKFDGIMVNYFVEAKTYDENEVQVLEPRSILVEEYTAVPDPMEGFVVTFKMPEMTGVVAGSTVRVSLHEAKSADGMPHYLFIEFKAKDASAPEDTDAILQPTGTPAKGHLYNLDGKQTRKTTKGIYLLRGKKVVLK